MDLERTISFCTADIRVIIHATEDENKILDSLCDIFSIPADRFQLVESIGHWGNRISLLTGRLESAEANSLVLKILSALNSVDMNRLSNSFHTFIDEKGNLYLRLDKQRICRKNISLSEVDSVRFRFKPVRRFKIDKNYDYLQRGFLTSKR
jgi:RNA binding exosome subunit